MVASLLTGQPPSRELADLLRPEPLPDGTDPEERLILCGLSWRRYLDLDKALGDDRPGPRFYYLDGDLEIMTTSNEHERIKKWIGDFMADYFFEAGPEVMPRGQATMRLALKQAGASRTNHGAWAKRRNSRPGVGNCADQRRRQQAGSLSPLSCRRFGLAAERTGNLRASPGRV